MEYDKVLRFEENDRIHKILYQIYQMDVYTSVAQVANECGFSYPKVCPTEQNILNMKGVFHPFLAKPVSNTLSVNNLLS